VTNRFARRLAASSILLLVPAIVRGQESRSCAVELQNAPETRQISYRLPSGNYNTFLGGGVYLLCRRDNMSLRADSAEVYGDEGRVYLVGRVRYEEPRMRLRSDFLNYFQADERVIAAGNVDATLQNGSRLRGPQAQYLRAMPQSGRRVEMSAVGRPQLTLPQAEASGEPTRVTANMLRMVEDTLLYGSGSVEIRRPDLVAVGDSIFANTQSENMRLMRGPRVDGRGERPFRLTGNLIDMEARQRRLERVISRGSANAESDDLTLQADTISLAVVEDKLERAIAWGQNRAVAVSPTQTVRADSLDVVLPDQRLSVVTAVGTAYAEGTPDTLRFRTTERDWMRGDTIVAHFDSAATDDGGRPQLREIESRVDARAYYQLAPADTAETRPAINYVRGSAIRVTFDSAQVRQVTVSGDSANPSSGVYLEPRSADATAEPGRDPERLPAAEGNGAPAVPTAGGVTRQSPAAQPSSRGRP
jgi:hypothetical protein